MFCRTMAVDLGDRPGGPVVLLHQLLARPAGGSGGEAELFGESRLVLEEQAVLAAPGVQVQVYAQTAQEGLALFEKLPLLVGDETEFLEILPAPAVVGCLGNPENDLQVAQATRSVLAVGFEAAGRVAEALMTVLLFHALGLKEGAPIKTSLEQRTKPLEQGATAGEQSGLDHRRLYGGIAGCLLQALFERAHAVAGLQSDVPEQADQPFELRRQHLAG
jgi:hypothetical protein